MCKKTLHFVLNYLEKLKKAPEKIEKKKEAT